MCRVVTVEVRRDTTLTGRFRMESDNPKAAWPSHVHVLAFLAVDGLPDGVQRALPTVAPDGTFVLRNAFGPRVLRTGYVPVPGSMWWPSKVLLDGKDVTNVPIDFSEHPDGQLEVVFTQHPASITGMVTDGEGQPVSLAWVTLTGTDRASGQLWATTSDVTQADEMGRFGIVVPPGAVPRERRPGDDLRLAGRQRGKACPASPSAASPSRSRSARRRSCP